MDTKKHGKLGHTHENDNFCLKLPCRLNKELKLKDLIQFHGNLSKLCHLRQLSIPSSLRDLK